MATYLVDTIRLLKRNPEAMLTALVSSYEKDFGTYAKGNNKAPLESAAKLLTTGKMDKTIKAALADGHTAGGLVDGYIGSVSGKWADQSDTVQAPFLAAIERATEAFRLTLVNSELFNEKPELTKEEKEKAKAEREAKKEKEAAEQKAAIIAAAVVAGEIVRASDINSVTAYSDFSLADLIGDRINSGMFLESAAESVAIDIGNKYPKAVTRVVDCMINLKQLDTVTMVLLLESIHKNMNAESFKTLLDSMGFEPVAKKTTAKKTTAKKTTAKKTTADTVVDTVADTVADTVVDTVVDTVTA